MARILSVALSVLLLSACAMLIENNETPVVEREPAPALEMQAVESSVPEAVEPPENERGRVPKKIPSKQEIRLLQTQLKAAGFDPGPIDGALGDRTLTALRRLQSGCSNLKDLLENPSGGISARDEIRLIQARLRDSGFDAGPVDGIMGLKTKAALLRAQAGCTVAEDWSATLEDPVQAAETIPSPMAASEKQQPVPFKASAATDSVREVDGQPNASEKSPGREEIRILQLKLKAAGFDPGPVDGIVGPKTNAALEQYRMVHGSSNSRRLSSGVKFVY